MNSFVTSYDQVKRCKDTVHVPPSKIMDSLDGSAMACGRFTRVLAGEFTQAPAVSIYVGLDRLKTEFDMMRRKFQALRIELSVDHAVRSTLRSSHATTIICAQERCQKVAKEIRDIMQRCEDWTTIVVPDHIHYRLQALDVVLQKQGVALELLLKVMSLVKPFLRYNDEDPDIKDEQRLHHVRCDRIRDLLRVERSLEESALKLQLVDHEVENKGSQQTYERLLDEDECSVTQSAGMMTPSEGWSDVGSDTTETGPEHTPTITRHSLQLCDIATTNFLNLIKRTEASFNTAPGAIPVSQKDTKLLHVAYNDLVVKLLHGLAAPVPLQDDRRVPALEMARPAEEAKPQVDSKLDNGDDELEKIISGMETPLTERDIMKLVFHWMTLDEFNGFTREDVMNS